MAENRKSFLIHTDSLSILEEMTDEQAGQLLKAIYTFQKGEDPVVDFAIKMAFIPFKNQFLRDQEVYKKVVERNRTNGPAQKADRRFFRKADRGDFESDAQQNGPGKKIQVSEPDA